MKVNVIRLEQLELRCSNCGSVLKYSPADKQVVCPNCGTKNDIPISYEDLDKAWEEKDLMDYLQRSERDIKDDRKQIIKCASCGAEVEFKKTIIAAQCPYCASPIVLLPEQIPRSIKPQALVPFAITREQAREQYRLWAKRKWFAKSDFRKYANAPKSLVAEYVPYWTYDADTLTEYSGLRGDYYYETEVYYENGQRKTRQVRRIRWTPVRGTVRLDFDDILIPASNNLSYLPDNYNWDTTELQPYEPKFLSGFYSEAYNVSLKQGFEQAKTLMDNVIRSAIRSDIGGDQQQIKKYKIYYSNLSFKHILLPVYHSVYKYKNKDYPFAINGQNGKVYGKYPVSVWKILLVILIVLLSLLAIYLGVEYNFDISAFWQDTFSQSFLDFFKKSIYFNKNFLLNLKSYAL